MPRNITRGLLGRRTHLCLMLLLMDHHAICQMPADIEQSSPDQQLEENAIRSSAKESKLLVAYEDGLLSIVAEHQGLTPHVHPGFRNLGRSKQ